MHSDNCYWCIKACIQPFCRIWGILTAVVMWGTGFELSYHHHPLGAYILVGAALLTFLETAFVVDFFLRVWIRDDGHCFLKFWDIVMWMDYWRKTVFYIIVGSICFVNPVHNWLGTIPGTMLILLGFAYLLFTFKIKKDGKDALLDSKVDTYDRFDDIQDDLDDSLPEPDGNVCTQENILEV